MKINLKVTTANCNDLKACKRKFAREKYCRVSDIGVTHDK